MLLHRAARLTGSVAVIRVGAYTEAEARALRDAAEDAVLAVRAALAEGIVPGGGLCLFRASRTIEDAAKQFNNRELCAAFTLVAEAMKSPLCQIAVNAGEDPDSIAKAVEDFGEAESGAIGYNAASGAFHNLVSVGVVDPAKVVRVALEKASSIAALILTSSCLIYFDPDAAHPSISPSPATKVMKGIDTYANQ